LTVIERFDTRKITQLQVTDFQNRNRTRSLAVTKRLCDCCMGQFWPNI